MSKSDKLITLRIPMSLFERLSAIATATYKSGSVSRLIKYILNSYLNSEVNHDNQ